MTHHVNSSFHAKHLSPNQSSSVVSTKLAIWYIDYTILYTKAKKYKYIILEIEDKDLIILIKE